MARQILTADRVITERQLKTLLRAIEMAKTAALATGNGRDAIVDFYLIAIAAQTGLRIAEVADLRLADLHDDFLIVRHGKGDKRRTVHYGRRTKQLITEHRDHQTRIWSHPCKPDDHLFIGQRGAIKRGAIHLRFKRWAATAGMPESITFHSLRHGAATRLLNAGVDLASVRDQLGHANISTTSIYLHFTDAGRDKIRAVL